MWGAPGILVWGSHALGWLLCAVLPHSCRLSHFLVGQAPPSGLRAFPAARPCEPSFSPPGIALTPLIAK